MSHMRSLRQNQPLNSNHPILTRQGPLLLLIVAIVMLILRPEEGDSRNLLCVLLCPRLNDLTSPFYLSSPRMGGRGGGGVALCFEKPGWRQLCPTGQD